MNKCHAKMPENAVPSAETQIFTEQTVTPGILRKHKAPEGKYGRLVVLSGKLRFVYEDTLETVEADAEHPVVVMPERYHHVELCGPVKFKVEFYPVESCPYNADETAERK